MPPTTAGEQGRLPRSKLSKFNKLLIGFAALPALLVFTLVALRLIGLICPFGIPTDGMAPTISRGDRVLMEGFTFLKRSPRRGDIVVFRTEGLPNLPQDQKYVKRVVGEPNEHLRIDNGKLYINDTQIKLTNSQGEILFLLPSGSIQPPQYLDLTVPSDHYFVVGDNTMNSLDSRYWGCLPRKNIAGRISFCYGPPGRACFLK